MKASDRLLEFEYNDGGARAQGHNHKGDCVTRAISIATGKSYSECFEDLQSAAGRYPGKGLRQHEYGPYYKKFGFTYRKLKPIGPNLPKFNECHVPRVGTFIVHMNRHVVAVINGVINDTYKCHLTGGGRARKIIGIWELTTPILNQQP